MKLVKKFPAFHGTRRFITALVSVRHVLRFINETQGTDSDKQTVMNGIVRVHVVRLQNKTQTGSVGPEAFAVFGTHFKKMNTKIGYECEYIFKMRKDIKK